MAGEHNRGLNAQLPRELLESFPLRSVANDQGLD